MRCSTAGLEFISRWEGEVLHVYDDAGGKATIGVGHLLKPGESFPDGITHEQALELLAEDIAIAESPVNEFVSVPLSQNAFDALCSFTFNIGGGAFMRSTLLEKLNKGDPDAAVEFLRWVHVGGVVNPGLVSRRNAERNLFLEPDANA